MESEKPINSTNKTYLLSARYSWPNRPRVWLAFRKNSIWGARLIESGATVVHIEDKFTLQCLGKTRVFITRAAKTPAEIIAALQAART
jgi:hypothetical protein